MTTQSDKAEKFRALHAKGDPVILYNIWDPGSARVVAEAGAKALATGSAPVAMAQNYGDGEKIPLELALTNAVRIVEQTELPVSLDFEGAYSADPAEIAVNVQKALETGVIGFNFEDQIVGTSDLYDVDTQAKRIGAVRKAIDESGTGAFLNARTDIFLKNPRDSHDTAMLDMALERASSFISAGADGFFAPGLADPALIERLCSSVSVPVNIIALPGTPPTGELKSMGVARISYGPVPYRKLMAALEEDAKQAFSGG
ncbi:MAG: isocitrate lyase/phosphoenolpyruvate mutase family protein [Pseudomonadota bacterium]